MPSAAYLHVPFCVHRCGYCDFTVIAGRDDLIGRYLDCLERELRTMLVQPHPVKTLFIGGGTPSLLPARDLLRLTQLLSEWLPLDTGGEYSVECNPDRFTRDRMDVLREAGANRISLGVQSFDRTHLTTLERAHDPESVKQVVEDLRRTGFENLSLDLIYAVPGQSVADWRATLDAAVSLSPQHLSTYGLTYEKGTAFWTRREKRTLRPVADELEREMYAEAMQILSDRGYRQYELSNFAQDSWECRHNRTYWTGESYYGFGPGAAAYLDGVRTINHRSVTAWMRRIEQGLSPVQEHEELNAEERAREAVMLGLRQTSGIDRQAFVKKHGFDIRDLAPASFDGFIETGLLEATGTEVRLSLEGRFLADSVMAEFL